MLKAASIKSLTIYRLFVFAQVDKLALVLLAMFGLPFFVHLIPVNSLEPLGAIWLPIFYAPLVAVLVFRFHVAVLAGMLAPMINMWITGRPEMIMAKTLTLELVVFVVLMKVLSLRLKNFWASGVFSYLLAKLFSILIFEVVWGAEVFPAALFSFLAAIERCLPGLLVLLLINRLAVQYRERKG